jgi:hypothetical protein
MDGSTTLGTANLVNGKASWRSGSTAIAKGTHRLVALYGGGPGFTKSSSATLTFTVS